MPVINYQGSQLNKEQKKELIAKLTATAVEITKVPAKFFTVTIQELSEDNLGVSGETVADIKARMQSQAGGDV